MLRVLLLPIPPSLVPLLRSMLQAPLPLPMLPPLLLQVTSRCVPAAGFADAASAPASPDGGQLLGSIPAPPLASNDIVDTFWDIPAIDIPSPEAIAKREKIQARRQQRAASSKPALSGGLPLFPGGASRPSQAETESFAPKEFDFDSIISGSADALSAKKGSHKADPEEAPRSHAKQIIIAAVVLIVVIALAVGGILVWRQHKNTVEYRQAMDACNAAVGQYSKADVALSTVLRDTKPMQGITPDQVADANTVVKLRDAVAAANRISVASGCPTSVTAADLRANAKDAKRITAELKSGVGDITSAAKAVTASKAAKDAANAAAIQGNLKPPPLTRRLCWTTAFTAWLTTRRASRSKTPSRPRTTCWGRTSPTPSPCRRR
jgi:hypothetical protein